MKRIQTFLVNPQKTCLIGFLGKQFIPQTQEREFELKIQIMNLAQLPFNTDTTSGIENRSKSPF